MMLSAKLLEAYCVELIYSDDQQRNDILEKLDETPIGYKLTDIEKQARHVASRFCQAVFDRYPPPEQPPKKGK